MALANIHPSRLAMLTTSDDNSSAQQQNQNASSQPPPAGGLFSSSTQSSQPQQSGGLFGSSTAQISGGGGGGGLFGSSAQQPQQPQQSGGLFGGSTTQQPQQQSGGLFGGSNNNTQSNMTSNQGTGLFGPSLNVPSQPQQQSGLFGSSTTQNRTGTGLFGAPAPTQTAPSGSSLFGGSAQPTGIFAGGNNQSSQPSMFASQTQQQQQANPSIFGLSASQPNQSLLGASMHRTSQMQPGAFSGKLTMGQPQAQQAAQTQGAVKINFDNMHSTTRYADCIDEVKSSLEQVDKMIQNQERFCREIEAFLPKHGDDVKSLSPDVDMIREKVEGVENALAFDAQGVEVQRKTVQNDHKDSLRCERVIENQKLPAQYHFAAFSTGQRSQATDGTESQYDVDLIGNYFVPMASSLQVTLDNYSANLKAIEAHMRVIESSTAAQAQQLAAKRAGMSNGGSGQVSGDDTVRELADTLRGFEAGILTSASLVGQCREGVNELVMGRLGGGGESDRLRRPW